MTTNPIQMVVKAPEVAQIRRKPEDGTDAGARLSVRSCYGRQRQPLPECESCPVGWLACAEARDPVSRALSIDGGNILELAAASPVEAEGMTPNTQTADITALSGTLLCLADIGRRSPRRFGLVVERMLSPTTPLSELSRRYRISRQAASRHIQAALREYPELLLLLKHHMVR